MDDLRKPEICPKCGCSTIKRIVGGRPSRKGFELIAAGEAVQGTCFLKKWKEDWFCTECKHQWCDKTDPARIEMERLYEMIISG